MSDTDVPLDGGNSGAQVRRRGATVLRQSGVGSVSVDRLLDHLRREGFDGAPVVLDREESGLVSLEWMDGPVAHQDLDRLTPQQVAAVGARIRAFHDASARFEHRVDDRWSSVARDPDGLVEVVCHNDLATWNLVATPTGWAFIDWDLAAPGRRSWDLAWTLCSLVGPTEAESDAVGDVTAIVEALLSGYGDPLLTDDVVRLAAERARREAARLSSEADRGARQEQRLVDEGHADAWESIAVRVRS